MKFAKELVNRVKTSARYRLGLFRVWCGIKGKKNIFVFGAPFHANMGDHAQSYCTEKWLKSNYRGYRIKIYETTDLISNNFSLMKNIRKCCNRRDKVFLHSGYHTTDLYMLEENMQRMAIQLFNDRPVVIFPQTIYYEKGKEREISRRIYNEHHDLTLMCRDEVSFETAKHLFPNCKRILMPDIVTTMIGVHHFEKARKGILLCLRNDKEAFYSQQIIDTMKTELEKLDTVDITDTTISASIEDIRKDREKILFQIWQKYAGYRAIVTDRYHGTIFSLIAGTPVVVVSSTDHKLSSGVKWFPESFQDYVCYEPDIYNVFARVKKIYATEYNYQLEPYFTEHYYNQLRQKIEEA